jgi:hypothetical protein
LEREVLKRETAAVVGGPFINLSLEAFPKLQFLGKPHLLTTKSLTIAEGADIIL